LRRILAGEKVRYLMRKDPFAVEAGRPVAEAIDGIRRRRTSCALVLRAGRLVGIFTERDHLDKIAGRSVDLDRPVDEFMTPDPATLAPDDPVAEALARIVDGGFRHVPVVEDGSVVGLLSSLDLVRYVAELHPTEVFNQPPVPGQIMAEAEGG
jgi:CBS domain-containing protein